MPPCACYAGLSVQLGTPRSAGGPFVTAENIANSAQKVTETLGFKSPGLFFQPPERVAAAGEAPTQPQPPQDPGVALAVAGRGLVTYLHSHNKCCKVPVS